MDDTYFVRMPEEEFKQLERQAWNGILDFSRFPAAEYKFFDTVQELGKKHRHDHYPIDFCKKDIKTARNVYKNESDDYQLCRKVWSEYQTNIMKVDQLTCEITKSEDVNEKLRLSLECIEKLLGEKGFAYRAAKNIAGKE